MVSCEALFRCRISELDAYSRKQTLRDELQEEALPHELFWTASWIFIFGAAQASTSRVEQFVGTDVPRKRSFSRQVHIGGTPLNSVTLGGSRLRGMVIVRGSLT